MAIPSFQDFMLPLLELLADGGEHRLADLYDDIARQLQVDAKERAEMLASGKQSRFENRAGWAKTYLNKAGLIDSPRRGICVLAPRGQDVLRQKPARIDIAFLRRFPEFASFTQASQQAAGGESLQAEESPEERLDDAYRRLRAELVQELIREIKAVPPSQFERLVIDLLLKMGYGGPSQQGWAVGRPGDEGIDGVINEDKLGLDVIYVQAKRWEGTVGRPTVQAFTGSLEGHHANKGVLITSSQFSGDAYDYVSRIGKKVVLIDGQRLAELMIEFKLGVSPVSTYEILRVDRGYFTGELASAAD